jgi:hypothetical protein
MSIIVIERSFSEPADYAELQRREDAAEWCRSTHQVQFLYSFVASDEKHVVCCYEAKDAESVRALQRKADLPVDHAWAATPVIDADHERPPGFSLVVAQRTLPAGVTLDQIRYMATDPKGCGKRLRLLHVKALLSADLKRMCCVYYSPDVESVRVGSRESGTPYDRVWSGRRIMSGEPG